jgi:hypothetical protein
MTRTRHLAALIAFAGAAGFWTAARAATDDEVRAAFLRFVQVQNAHDGPALQDLLLDSGQFLWVTRGTPIWGREAAINWLVQNYEGTWKLDPEWDALRVVPVGSDAAQLFVPVQFTIGAAGQTATVSRFYINQLFLRTPAGWRVVSILPIPAPAK